MRKGRAAKNARRERALERLEQQAQDYLELLDMDNEEGLKGKYHKTNVAVANTLINMGRQRG
jgi:hypothetical protein